MVTDPAARARFYEAMLPYAQNWSQQSGIPVGTLLAIIASESNYGTAEGNALFGIVGRPGSAGSTQQGTQTGQQQFAAYSSPDEAWNDFQGLVSTGRYQQAWGQRQDGRAFVQGLQAAGYAGSATPEDQGWSDMIGGLSQDVDRYLSEKRRTPAVPSGSAGGYAGGGQVPAYAEGGSTGGDHAEFIRRYLPVAMRYQQQYGISASALLGIAASESNWGNTPGYALFGIVGVPGTAGTVRLGTETGSQAFAAFNTPEESFDAFIRLASTSSRYQTAWANRADPAAFVSNLQAGGYAGSATANDRTWSNTITTGMIPQVVAAARQLQSTLPAATTTPAAAAVPAASTQQVRATIATPDGAALPADTQRGWTMPAAGPITSLFGTNFNMDAGRWYEGKYYDHFNAGIDIGAGAGAPVYAITGGTVVAAGPTGDGWGYAIRVRDANGNIHNYGHTAQAMVQVGQQIAPGTPLGIVGHGQVGTSTGPHLSYDVWNEKTGAPVDPTPYLSGGREAASAKDPALPGGGGRVAAMPDPGTTGTTATGSTGTTTPPKNRTPEQEQSYNSAVTAALAVQQRIGTALQTAWDEYDKASPDRPVINGQTHSSPKEDAFQKIQDLQKQYDSANNAVASATRAAQMGQAPEDKTAKGNELAGVAGATNANVNVGQFGIPFFNANTEASKAQAGAFNYVIQALNAIASMNGVLFGQGSEVYKMWDGALSNSFTQFMGQQNLKLQQGQLDITGWANAVTNGASMLAANAAWAGQRLAEAKYVSDEKWKLAERLLPPGVEYQPGFGPKNAMADAQRSLGQTPTVYKTQPLPEGWNDPWANIRTANQQAVQNGQATPDQVLGPAVAGGYRAASSAASLTFPQFQPDVDASLGNRPGLPAATGADTQATDAQTVLAAFLGEGNATIKPPTPLATPPAPAPISPTAIAGAENRLAGQAPPTTPTNPTLGQVDPTTGKKWNGQVWVDNFLPPAPPTSGSPGQYAAGGQVPAYDQGTTQQPIASAGGPRYALYWNNSRMRWEEWQVNSDGTQHLIKAVIDPSADNSDLPPTVQTTPVPGHLQGKLGSMNPEDVQARNEYVAMLSGAFNQAHPNQGTGTAAQGAAGAGAQGGNSGLRFSAEDIMADAQRISSGFDARAAIDKAKQAEYALEQEIRQAGGDPSYYKQLAGLGPWTPTGVADVDEQPGPGMKFGPEYVRALTAWDQAAVQGALLSRGEGLQRFANAWAQGKTGGERMQDFGGQVRAIRSMRPELEASEQQLNADPNQDVNLRYDSHGNWAHSQNMGGYAQMNAARQKADELMQQWWPEQWQYEQEKRRQNGGQGSYASGGQVPALAEGAWNMPTMWGGGGGSQQPNSTPFLGELAQMPAQDTEATFKSTLGNDLEAEQMHNQLANLRQSTEQQKQQMWAEAARQVQAIEAQMANAQTGFNRQSNQLQQGQAIQAGRQAVRPFYGGQPTGYAA